MESEVLKSVEEVCKPTEVLFEGEKLKVQRSYTKYLTFIPGDCELSSHVLKIKQIPLCSYHCEHLQLICEEGETAVQEHLLDCESANYTAIHSIINLSQKVGVCQHLIDYCYRQDLQTRVNLYKRHALKCEFLEFSDKFRLTPIYLEYRRKLSNGRVRDNLSRSRKGQVSEVLTIDLQ